MNIRSITWGVALSIIGMSSGYTWAEERPMPLKPLKVLLIGNSQCPTIINNQLLEKLA